MGAVTLPTGSATVNALKKEGASALAREPVHIAAQRRDLGRRLATARNSAGLTQHDLARALYYERTSVAHIEGGRQPAPRSFWERADALLGAGGALLGGYDDLERAKTAPAARAAPAAPLRPSRTRALSPSDGSWRRLARARHGNAAGDVSVQPT